MSARASSVGTAILLLSFLLCSYRDGKIADATVKGNAQVNLNLDYLHGPYMPPIPTTSGTDYFVFSM
jgi:hypothetical protein